MRIKNVIGDKLSTQSLVLGKKFGECGNNISDFIFNEHHLIRKHQIYYLEKLNSRELYNMKLILKVEKPTTQPTYIFFILLQKQTFSGSSCSILSKMY